MDVMNAENAGAIFCPASPKAPTVSALIHAIRGARKGYASMDAGIEHGCIHPTPKFHSPSVMVNSLTNLGAGVPNFDLR
ncbi:MAG: hypothetical protein CVV06_18095 [Gammaproteobacteria bacterium HGW-Gammaproteobacteria-10]|nr:MAG: hypothetical protein CVV06_18095 [Gammaproteobacteria bacterium HGW-Gammaproteobacteria-10]